MLQDSDTTTEHRRIARIGADGLAQIGASRYELAGIRFAVDDQPNDRTDVDGDDTDGDDVDESGDEQDSDTEGDSDDEGFDGEFDAKRARTLINRLRGERDKARSAAAAAKNSPDLSNLQKENLRLKIGLQTGLDADLVDRLRGDTEDELLEDAQKLLDRFFPGEKKLEDRTPKARLRGGSKPEKDPEVPADDVVTAALGR